MSNAATRPIPPAKLRSGWTLRSIPLPELLQGRVDPDLADLHEYDILSENAYQDTREYKLDWENEKIRIPLPGWTEVPNLPSIPQPPADKLYLPGLAYEVWEKDTEAALHTALVFRGSERNVDDWKTNARWFAPLFFPGRWDQYHQTRTLIKPLVAFLEQRAAARQKRLRLIATGHSLGGGLAQHAAYASGAIKLVVAFDSSPVTGYYDIPFSERLQNRKDVKVIRAYEIGEALAYFRNLMKVFYPAPYFKTTHPQILELGFNFLGQQGVASQHSMRRLAEGLFKLKEQLLRPAGQSPGRL
ncbi:MAG: hypothetical protein IT260_18810 [Saprospiraceae bacterium]|nr:hypothetical protein [Saprospiraceae bacterium]